METVVYNGVDLGERFVVAGFDRPLPTASPEVQYVSGGNRNFVRGMEYEPPTIGFTVICRELGGTARRAAARDLASILLVDGPVKVAFSDDMGLYYKAVPQGALELHEFVRCGSMAVTLQCVESALYGESKSASAASGGTATFNVGGTAKTMLSISAASAVRNSSSYLYGVRLDEAEVMRVEIGTSSASRVAIDGDERTVAVNGATGQLTLASDWFEVGPGKHTVRNDVGSGAFTVSWVERWL